MMTQHENPISCDVPVPGKPLSPIEEQLLALLDGTGMTRRDIVATLGIPRSTAFDNLHKLIRRGKVDKEPRREQGRGRGRPAVYYFRVAPQEA
jgi:predicted ArsR family transcriptional regulator